MTDDKIPFDFEAEQALLGAMLLSAAALESVIDTLSGADFYRPAHQIIFEAIAKLHADGDPADAVTVSAAITKNGDQERTGGAPYLHTLITTAGTPGNADSYATLVKGSALQRRLIEAGTRIVQTGYAVGPAGAAEALERAQAELFALADHAGARNETALSARMPIALDEIEAVGSRGGQLTGVPTGFTDLDALLNGLRPGLVHTVFGAPAIGTSTLVLDFARAAAIKHGLTVQMFSGQSPAGEVMNRMLAAEARVPLHSMRSGTMRDDDWTRLARRMEEVARAPLFIEDNPSLTVEQIRAECRRLKARHDLRLVIIDGVNLFARPTAPESLWAAQTRLSADIKRLAAELRVPVVLTAPTNRRADNRIDRRPDLADIASSSAYAADADLIIGLHREDAYEKESPRAGEADLIVLKNRYGPTATVTVAFQGHYARFVDMAHPEPAPSKLRPVPGEDA